MERPVVIPNKAQGIYGILHLPSGFESEPSRTGLVLIHSQGGSKIGHKRSFVELGRRLEAKGVAVLRFDLLGEGESEELLEDPYLNWRGIIPAVDYLNDSLAIDRFIILGDCFGGLLGAYYAKLDSRVEQVIVWNLAQMKWTEELLEGYGGVADIGVDGLSHYARKLFTKDAWLKLLTFSLNYSVILRRAILKPALAYARRATRVFSLGPRSRAALRLRCAARDTASAERRVPVKVLHASSPPGSERVVSIARHVFSKLGYSAEHILIPGIPFSRPWKALAYSHVENCVLGRVANQSNEA